MTLRFTHCPHQPPWVPRAVASNELDPGASHHHLGCQDPQECFAGSSWNIFENFIIWETSGGRVEGEVSGTARGSHWAGVPGRISGFGHNFGFGSKHYKDARVQNIKTLQWWFKLLWNDWHKVLLLPGRSCWLVRHLSLVQGSRRTR